MTRGILSKVLEDIGDAQAEARAEDYGMVNVRPGEKAAAMLEILSSLSGKSPSALFTDVLSDRLAGFAIASPDNGPAILDAAEAALKRDGAYGFQPDSALELLEKAGVLKIENSFLKDMPKLTLKKRQPSSTPKSE